MPAIVPRGPAQRHYVPSIRRMSARSGTRQLDAWTKDRSALSRPQGFIAFAHKHSHA
jgi:hypothetical protein